jgi:hypothetical protein
MVEASRYWIIRRINSVNQGWVIQGAKEYFQQQFPDLANVEELSEQDDQLVQDLLLSQFKNQEHQIDIYQRAIAGLCLRCFVSYDILGAVRQLVKRFVSEYRFEEEEAHILPLVLNDDGQSFIVLNDERTSQQVLDGKGQPQHSSYNVFAVEVLRKFQQLSNSQSLTNWTYYLIRQHPELNNFLLWEYGLCVESNWALLNRANPERLDGLNHLLLDAFHRVYRRDRRRGRLRGRCQDPSSSQLKEMLAILQASGVMINSLSELMRELIRVAESVRNERIWQQRGYPSDAYSLDEPDPNTGQDVSRDIPDPDANVDAEEEEENEWLTFFREELIKVFPWAIEQGIRDRVADLENRRRYAVFASRLIPGLKLFYGQAMSQRQIAEVLGMTNQTQVTRILQPKELLKQVRFITVNTLLERILERANKFGLIGVSQEPDYLRNLMEQVEVFVDDELFNQAMAELKAGTKNRSSQYAEYLCRYLNSLS